MYHAMHYLIPASPQEIFVLRQKPVNEESVAAALAAVIQLVRSQGHSLEHLTDLVLADDSLLDFQQRRSLSEIVAQAWESFA